VISLYRYRLPFIRPFSSAGRSWSVRTGLLIRFTAPDTDITAEAAPLPGFSKESIREVEDLMLREKDRLNHLLEGVTTLKDLNTLQGFASWPPSVRFAVSTLIMQLIQDRNPEDLASLPVSPDHLAMRLSRSTAQASGNRTLSDKRVQHSGPGRKTSGKTTEKTRENSSVRLRVNAVIGLGSPENRFSETLKLYEEGYRTIKYKCGSHPGTLPQLLERVSKRLPDLTIRIDVNGSWSPEETLSNLNQFAGLPVEYVEEPCPFTSLEAFSKIRDNSPLPLALDESITSLKQLEQIHTAGRVDAVILKPTLLGSIPEIIATTGGVNAPVKRVFTSALESAIARKAITRLALLAGSADTAHGLDTGRLFQDDLIRSEPTGGRAEPSGRAYLTDSGHWCTPFSDCRQEFLEKLSP